MVNIFIHHSMGYPMVSQEYVAYYGTVAGYIGLQITKILSWFNL